MIPSSYSIVYDLENPSIRNNEPNSQITDDDHDIDHQKKVNLEASKDSYDKTDEPGASTPSQIHKNLIDRTAIDPTNIISEKRSRKKTLKAM